MKVKVEKLEKQMNGFDMKKDLEYEWSNSGWHCVFGLWDGNGVMILF